jgi:hypothetical protein
MRVFGDRWEGTELGNIELDDTGEEIQENTDLHIRLPGQYRNYGHEFLWKRLGSWPTLSAKKVDD